MTTIDPNSLNGNLRLLTLLRAGARITFPDTTYLNGHPDTAYVDVGTEFGSEGLWSLDEGGITNALDDLRQIRKQAAATAEQ